jgi:uncharacterized protein YkwD
MRDRIADWLHALDLPQRRWLAVVGALVAVTALAVGLTALTGDGDGSSRVALETEGDGSTTSTEPADTSTSSTASSVPADGSTSSSTASTSAPGRSTSTTRRGASTSATTDPPAGSSTTQSTTTTTTTARTSDVTRDAGAEDRVAELFTSHRAANGLASMRRSGGLDQVAVSWARHLAETRTLSHQSGDNIIAACPAPCTGWAENVGYAQSADGVWAGWRGSSVHWTNINDPHAGFFGVGAFRTPDGNVWVAHVFGRTG